MKIPNIIQKSSLPISFCMLAGAAAISLVTVSTPAPVKAEPATEGNLSLSVPTQIQYVMRPDGTLMSPSPETIKLENTGTREIRVSSMGFSSAAGWSLSSDSGTGNVADVVVGTQEESVSSQQAAGQDVELGDSVRQEASWTLAARNPEYGWDEQVAAKSADASVVPLTAGGEVSALGDDAVSGPIGSTSWYVVDSTVTNDVYDELDALKQRVSQLEDETPLNAYPVGAVYISTSLVDPAEVLGGGTWQRIEDEFLLAAGSTYNAGSTGGSATNTLTTSQLPSHTHTYDKASANTGSTSLTVAQLPSHTHTYSKADANTGSTTLTINQIPSHMHNIRNQDGAGSNGLCSTTATTGTDGNNWCFKDVGVDKTANSSGTFATTYTGGGQGHTHTIGQSSQNTGGAGSGNGHTHTISTSSTNSGATGSGEAVNNMPPYVAVYVWQRTA